MLAVCGRGGPVVRTQSRARLRRLAIRGGRVRIVFTLHASRRARGSGGGCQACDILGRRDLAPAAGPLLAQAATALLPSLESAEREVRNAGPLPHARGKTRADSGVGEPKSVGRLRASAFARRAHRARDRTVERVFHPAAVRALGNRHQPCRRSSLGRRSARPVRRDPSGLYFRHADRRAGRNIASRSRHASALLRRVRVCACSSARLACAE